MALFILIIDEHFLDESDFQLFNFCFWISYGKGAIFKQVFTDAGLLNI